MDYLPFLWLGVAVFAAIVEAAVPALVSIWFVVGGVAALLASLLHAPFWLQVALFVVGSAVALAVTRPLARRAMKHSVTPTNADRVLGAEGTVTEPIGGGFSAVGRVSVQGASWAAQVENHEEIAVGETVVVERIEGVRLIVRRK